MTFFGYTNMMRTEYNWSQQKPHLYARINCKRLLNAAISLFAEWVGSHRRVFHKFGSREYWRFCRCALNKSSIPPLFNQFQVLPFSADNLECFPVKFSLISTRQFFRPNLSCTFIRPLSEYCRRWAGAAVMNPKRNLQSYLASPGMSAFSHRLPVHFL